MLCSQLTEVNYLVDTAFITPLPCKRWTCEYCRPKRTAQLIAQAIDGHPTKFITLTCNPARHAHPEAAARALIKSWRKIRRKAMRVYGYKKLPFMSVIELTKKGWPHLHILARVEWIDQRWLSDEMDASQGAHIVDIRKVDGTRAVARYVAKYIGKAPIKVGTLKRYWRSRDWEQKSDEEKEACKRKTGQIHISRQTATWWHDHFIEAGWTVHTGHDGAVAFRSCHAHDPPATKLFKKVKQE